MMNKTIKNTCLFIAILLLHSCYNNVIHFDKDTQSIERAHGYLLNITIENSDMYLIAVQENGCESKKFYLKNMQSSNPNFIFNRLKINNLSPNTEYKITTHSNGDAGPYPIHIKTDSMGIAYEIGKESWSWY